MQVLHEVCSGLDVHLCAVGYWAPAADAGVRDIYARAAGVG